MSEVKTKVIGHFHGVDMIYPVAGMKCADCSRHPWPTFRAEVPERYVCAVCRKYGPPSEAQRVARLQNLGKRP